MRVNKALWIILLLALPALFSFEDGRAGFMVLVLFCLSNAMFYIPQKFKGKGPLAFLIRRSVYSLPYLVPVVGLDLAGVETSSFIILGVISVSISVWWSRLEELKDLLNQDFMLFEGKSTPVTGALQVYNQLLAISSEEIFFRFYIVSQLKDLLGLGSVFVSTVLFVLAHYLTPWGSQLSKKDLATQTILSIFWGGLYILTDNLIYSLLGHLVFNSPFIVREVMKVFISEEISEDSLS